MTVLIRVAAMVVGALLAQENPPAAPVTPSPAAPPSLPTQSLPVSPGNPPAAPEDGGAKLSQDASVQQVLEALERRGQNLKDFTADVVLTEGDPTLGDTTKQKGTAIYQRRGEGGARVRVTFETKQQGKKIFNDKREYLLEDGWLTDRDYGRKTEVRRQVVRPGEKVDLLKLGEGPFPLPVGQSPESVEKQFEVTKVPAAKGDPAGTVHIRLTPRQETQFANKFQNIDVWVDTKTEMPVRIRTLDVNGTTERQTDLNLKGVNTGLKDGDFALEPTPGDWERHSEEYKE